MRLAFETIHGIAVPAVTVRRMRELCDYAAEQSGLQWVQMTENAGRNLAATAMRMLGSHWMESRILVLSGLQLGEAGICAARHLANRGASVSLCMAHPKQLTASGGLQHKAFRATGSTVIAARNLPGDDFDLVVDSLTGASDEAPASAAIRDLICWANDIGAPVLSMDAPSGINASTGERYGAHIRPSQTMTLGLPKTGLLPDLTGTLSLADIGLPVKVFSHAGLCYTPPFGVDFVVPLRALPTA
jgi:NAD(P)H-hydrate epimerase